LINLQQYLLPSLLLDGNFHFLEESNDVAKPGCKILLYRDFSLAITLIDIRTTVIVCSAWPNFGYGWSLGNNFSYAPGLEQIWTRIITGRCVKLSTQHWLYSSAFWVARPRIFRFIPYVCQVCQADFTCDCELLERTPLHCTDWAALLRGPRSDKVKKFKTEWALGRAGVKTGRGQKLAHADIHLFYLFCLFGPRRHGRVCLKCLGRLWPIAKQERDAWQASKISLNCFFAFLYHFEVDR